MLKVREQISKRIERCIILFSEWVNLMRLRDSYEFVTSKMLFGRLPGAKDCSDAKTECHLVSVGDRDLLGGCVLRNRN